MSDPDSRTESTPQASDRAITEGLRAGDARVTERFVRDNIVWVKALAQRLVKDEGLAEDCAQEALFTAIRRIDSFQGRAALKTWLHRITVNAALTRLRRNSSLAETSIDELLPEFDASACRVEAAWSHLATPEEVIERSDLRELVRTKIYELPDSYRTVLQLRDLEELSTAETAEQLGLSEANVRVRLHRARSALKKLLEPVLRGSI